MRFLADGPSIPDELLVARDAGNVVFFCGAGVSQAEAKLPDFETLAQAVVDSLRSSLESPARNLLKVARKQERITGVGGLIATDRIFGLLEREFDVNEVRTAIAEAIRPTPDCNLQAHQILIDLATSPAGVTRLVTTNFDRLFEQYAPNLKTWGPPRLPDPLDGREFQGIVHLHGRVDNNYHGPDSSEFVISSADFGRAYLSDGWATRFIQTLLTRYTVVFVGYSANDPPVQYLLEALNLQAGTRERLFAFQEGTSGEAAALWQHRGVQAIHFDATDRYRPLWDTLAGWAKRARDVDGWYEQVLKDAARGPAELTPHIRGQVAHVFATAEGARRVATAGPPLDASWLLVLDPDQRYATPVKVEPHSKTGEVFDPFTALGLDTDDKPETVDPTRLWLERRKRPADAWDVFRATRADAEGTRQTDGSALKGSAAERAGDLPPRLASIAKWIGRVAHQPITLWWAAQQSGVHPSIRDDIEILMRLDPERFNPMMRRGWRLLFAAWDDRRGEPSMLIYTIGNRAKVEGWSDTLVRSVTSIYRPQLKVKKRFYPAHPLAEGWTASEGVIYAGVEYPSPHDDLPIPDQYLRHAVSQFRANLELAISLKAEIAESDCLHIQTSRADDGDVLSETDNGLTGPIVKMQNLMGRLATIDPTAARTELAGWPVNDKHVFARLRIWAASQALLSPHEAALIFLELSDEVFWSTRHRRDLLYALRDRWSNLVEEDWSAIELRLRTGFNPLGTDDPGFNRAAFDRLSCLHWLISAGVYFGFDASAEIEALRAVVPQWTEQAGNETADSRAPKVTSFRAITDPQSLLYVPLSDVIRRAREAAAIDFRSKDQHEPFSGLAEQFPARALAALTRAGRRGESSLREWQIFLGAERRTSDSRRVVTVIVAGLVRLPLPDLGHLSSSICYWMEQAGKRLYEVDSKVLPELWDRVIEAMNGTTPARRHRLGDSWADDAVNSSIWALFGFLLKDPTQNARKPGQAFSPSWISRLDQLMGLGQALHCQVIAAMSFQLDWLFTIDPVWTSDRLLALAESDQTDGDAFWDGIVKSARFPKRDLFVHLKPALMKRARRPHGRRHQQQIMAGFLLEGWGGDQNSAVPERLIDDRELREILIWSGDAIRKAVLTHLRDWSADPATEWPSRLALFFTQVWPKQRALRTPSISSQLTELLFASGDQMPMLTKSIVPRLVPFSEGSLGFTLANDTSAGNPVQKYPTATLDVLWAILGEDSSGWPYQIEITLDRLENALETCGDPRLATLSRRRGP